MHNNYFFIKNLCHSLRPSLEGATLIKCYSQSKDELIFEFLEHSGQEFFIKAHLNPQFSCLYFPQNFARSRRNSIDLFHELIGKKITEVRALEYERGFFLDFEPNFSMFFKMYGNRSNIVLLKDGEAIDLFHKKMKNDLELTIDSIKGRKMPDLSKVLTYQDLKKYCPFLLGVPEFYMKEEKWESLPNSQKTEFIAILINHLENSQAYFITEINNQVHLSLIKTGDQLRAFNDPLSAINRFFITFLKISESNKIKKEWLSKLSRKSSGIESYIRKNQKRLNDLKNKLQFGHLGDLIMANLHNIEKGAELVELQDFENPEKTIAVKLKPSLNPQKNAENYYRKAKNQGIEIRNLESNLRKKKMELEEILVAKEKIESSDDVKELKSIVAGITSGSIKTETQKESVPFYQNEINGFTVYVGKSAKGNDTLIQKYATKNDLWLHAKDTQGSHVIIKKKGNQDYPKSVIEKAAQLAAFYSKRKGESLCPVSYTEKKYVRKRKGDPPGAVVVDREKVLMVVPSRLE